MAEGPQQLLEVCGQRLSRFLSDAHFKHLAWLREVEEQGMRMLKSSFRDEPMLLPKTPSQRRKLRKRQSSWMREENKELSRRRLSRRRSGVKLQSSSLSSQQCMSQEQPWNPGCEGQDVSVPGCAPGSQAGITPQLPALPGEQPEEAHVPLADLDCRECPQPAAGGDAAPPAVLGQQLPEVDAAKLQDIPGVPGILAEQPGRDGEQNPRRASTSTPKATQNGDPAALQGDGSPQSLETLLFQDSPSKSVTRKSRTRRRSGLGAPRRSHRASLAEKCSLASRRENMIRRSISRTRKAAAGESSSASSRVSCQSSLEAFVEEDVTSSTRMKGCKQALGVLWQRQQTGFRTLSPLDEKHKTLANQAPSSPSPASKAVRPLKNFLQGQGGGIKDFIKRNTPTRPHLKEKERQRLENLRKKQEAEEQRKKKVEEEKRQRQAEMKQKREERLRKALQARERAEQMEEKKKKRMEQKILQSDEKVRRLSGLWASPRVLHISQVKEEKVAEERSKRKGSKKHGEVEARKQKAVKGEEHEQQEPLQKRREDEVKERGKTVLELKNLLEQKQLGQAKERCELMPVLEQGIDHSWGSSRCDVNVMLHLGSGEAGAGGCERVSQAAREGEAPQSRTGASSIGWQGHQGRVGVFWEQLFYIKHTGWAEDQEADGQQQPREEKKPIPPAAPGTWPNKAVKCCSPCSSLLSVWFQKSLSTSCLGSLKDAQGPGSPLSNENSYGLDLNSDDSTDDESNPRKPIPAWADGAQLQQAIVHQYYHPPDLDALFGAIPSPKLEDIFYKNKPRYFKRTSSAVWHSPPGPSCTFQS
ncbi:Inner centromere protein [Lonchura striata]|uniref:Inner centromere protein n=1 Tax=Lonchura striata TaxID=40157 RepID=A0A218UVA5_9PASE|nr:Inner centromere protein [Lonchura striata domestica]